VGVQRNALGKLHAEREHTIRATDPAIGIHWPSVPGGLRMSDCDRDVPPLAEVRAADLLPTWEETRAFIACMRRGK
jgi:dTDP-4-dehydrorhamnose 3,5-epimerase